MKLTYVSPDGTTIEFSRDAADYKLLKRYSGLFETPVSFSTDKSPYQHGETLLDTLMEPRDVSFDVLILALEGETVIVPGTPPVNIPSDNTSVFGDAVFGDMIFGDEGSGGSTPGTDPTIYYSSTLDILQQRIYALARALSPLDGDGILYYEREDGTVFRLYCSNNNSTLDPDNRSDIHQKATINLRAHDPIWYSGIPHSQSFGTSTTSRFPISFPFEFHRGLSNNHTLINAGNADAPVDITIWGPITDPVLANITTGKTLSLDLELVAGDRFDITTGKDRITALYTPVSTGIPVNGQGYVVLGSKFWTLQKGANSVEFSCATSSAGSGATIIWSDQYGAVF